MDVWIGDKMAVSHNYVRLQCLIKGSEFNSVNTCYVCYVKV